VYARNLWKAKVRVRAREQRHVETLKVLYGTYSDHATSVPTTHRLRASLRSTGSQTCWVLQSAAELGRLQRSGIQENRNKHRLGRCGCTAVEVLTRYMRITLFLFLFSISASHVTYQ